jgi:hypothetical protein
MLIFTGLFIAALFHPIYAAIPVVLGLPFFILFITNLVAGPTCVCYLTTSVQTIKLPMPNRFNQVPIFLEFLQKAGVYPAVG